MVKSVLDSAKTGIQNGFKKAAEQAERISRPETAESPDKMVDSFTKLNQAEREVQANAKVVKTAKELDDALLDIIA